MKKILSRFCLLITGVLTFALTSCSFYVSDGNGNGVSGSTGDATSFFEENSGIIAISCFIVFVICVIIIVAVMKSKKK